MYFFDGRIRYSEVGPDRLLTPESLVDYFQDCSTFQSEDLGIGIGFTKARHIAWLVNYWQIDVRRYAALGERIRTGTSPYQLKGFMGLRNFCMETQDGERLVQANSVWSLVNTDVMHPTRIPPEITEKYTLDPKLDMEYLPRKIPVPAQEGERCDPLQVQEYHLDTNNHMNNGQYLRIAMHLLPGEGRPRRIRIAYQKQAVLGDTVCPVRYRCGEDTYVVAMNDGQGDPYAVVQFVI